MLKQVFQKCGNRTPLYAIARNSQTWKFQVELFSCFPIYYIRNLRKYALNSFKHFGSKICTCSSRPRFVLSPSRKRDFSKFQITILSWIFAYYNNGPFNSFWYPLTRAEVNSPGMGHIFLLNVPTPGQEFFPKVSPGQISCFRLGIFVSTSIIFVD